MLQLQVKIRLLKWRIVHYGAREERVLARARARNCKYPFIERRSGKEEEKLRYTAENNKGEHAPYVIVRTNVYRGSVTSLGSADYLLVGSEGSGNMADRSGVERLIDNLSVKFRDEP